MPTELLETVRQRATQLWEGQGLLGEPVAVAAHTLTVREAIDDPDGDEFPLQKGKEQLMEAAFRGEGGQAFTDRFGDFTGTMADVAALPLTNNDRRAVFVAAGFPLTVLGRDPDNIDTVQYGVPILGPDSREETLAWADLLVVTGSTLANDSIGDFLAGPPVVFYGTTVAGAAALMGWERFCVLSR